MAGELEPPPAPGAGLAAVAAELVYRVRTELPVVGGLQHGAALGPPSARAAAATRT